MSAAAKGAEEGGSRIKTLLSYMLTCLGGLLFSALLTLSDALILSYGSGSVAVTAVSLIAPFTMLQGGISTTFGMGAAVFVSRAVGKKEWKEGGEAALSAMIGFWTVALFVTALGFALKRPLLTAFGATGEFYEPAERYFTVLLAANVFSTGFSSIIRAEGNLLYGVLIWVIPISLNLALDAAFVFGLGWGAAGSAWATAACQLTSASMSILFFTRFSRLDFKGVRPSFGKLRQILLAGVPTLAQSGSLALILAPVNFAMERLGGAEALTAFSFAFKVLSFGVLPLTALAQGLMPVVGFDVGANRPQEGRKTTRTALVMGPVLGLICALIVGLWSNVWLGLLTRDNAIVASASRLVRLIAPALIPFGIPMILGADAQARGKILRAIFFYLLPSIPIGVLVLILCLVY